MSLHSSEYIIFYPKYTFLHYIFLFADTALCAGAEGRDTCDGDGGGPLVCEQDGQWYQVCTCVHPSILFWDFFDLMCHISGWYCQLWHRVWAGWSAGSVHQDTELLPLAGEDNPQGKAEAQVIRSEKKL